MYYSKEDIKKMMMKWSIFSVVAIALFWLVWHLIKGSIPEVTEIRMTESWLIQLPFTVSYDWSILLGPIYFCAFAHLFTNDSFEKKFLVVMFIVGLLISLIIGLLFGWVTSSVVVLVLDLVIIRPLSKGFSFIFALIIILIFNSFIGLTISLFLGSDIISVMSLVLILIIGIAIVCKHFLKKISFGVNRQSGH
ncbi:hypothetical protein K8R66_00165 [bacterium]|nr:hypothetical protein [bacterium]